MKGNEKMNEAKKEAVEKEKNEKKDDKSFFEGIDLPEEGLGARGEKGEKNKFVKIKKNEYEELLARAAEAEEYKNRYLKVHADYENSLKRMQKEKEEFFKFANEAMINRLVPIIDNFDMAMQAMGKTDNKEQVLEGIRIIQNEFHKVLEENGVQRIETKGKKFDPNFHEAASCEETDEFEDGMVMEELKPGYLLNGRLLRPAYVKVAKAVEKKEEEKKEG